MSKPSWEDAPDWAAHLALAADGCWYWCETLPRVEGLGWVCEGRREYAGLELQDWTQSREKRP